MKKKNTLKISLISALLAVSACESIKIRNTRAYAVAGRMDAGANWAETLSDETGEISLEEFIEFLEPSDTKGAAICQSAEDFNANKTALEQACHLLGKACSYDMREAIEKVGKRINKLQTLSMVGKIQMKIISTIPKQGDVGRDIATYQEALRDKGFDVGKIDGIFGSKTKKATSAFQKSKGLPGSGKPGPKTLIFLGIEVKPYDPITNDDAITTDLKGKQDRHLHPAIRLQIEKIVFPNRQIPKHWRDADLSQCHVDVSRAVASLGIREEGGNNKGRKVGQVQDTIGPKKPEFGNGDSWCLYLGQIPIAFLEDFFKIESPVPATAHCVTCWNLAKKIEGLTTQTPTNGTLGLGQYKPKSNGHAMNIVEVKDDGTMVTCEGNTSIKSLADGDGSGIKVRNQKKNGGLITLGFVFAYPHNKLPGHIYAES